MEAAKAAGISVATFTEWMRIARDREPPDPYAVFAAAVKEGEGAAAPALLAIIRKAARKHWTAAAWILERRWPHRWGRRELKPQEKEEKPRGVLVELPADMPLEEAKQVLQMLERNEKDPKRKAEYQAALEAMQGATT